MSKEEYQDTHIPKSTNILIEGELLRRSKSNILQLKTRYFVLYEDRLVYYKVTNFYTL